MVIKFIGAESKSGKYAANYMISGLIDDDDPLYAEVKVPDGASDDYGYMALKREIIRQAAERGINQNELLFWYYDDDNLPEDAYVDCDVRRW